MYYFIAISGGYVYDRSFFPKKHSSYGKCYTGGRQQKDSADLR